MVSKRTPAVRGAGAGRGRGIPSSESPNKELDTAPTAAIEGQVGVVNNTPVTPGSELGNTAAQPIPPGHGMSHVSAPPHEEQAVQQNLRPDSNDNSVMNVVSPQGSAFSKVAAQEPPPDKSTNNQASQEPIVVEEGSEEGELAPPSSLQNTAGFAAAEIPKHCPCTHKDLEMFIQGRCALLQKTYDILVDAILTRGNQYDLSLDFEMEDCLEQAEFQSSTLYDPNAILVEDYFFDLDKEDILKIVLYYFMMRPYAHKGTIKILVNPLLGNWAFRMEWALSVALLGKLALDERHTKQRRIHDLSPFRTNIPLHDADWICDELGNALQSIGAFVRDNWQPNTVSHDSITNRHLIQKHFLRSTYYDLVNPRTTALAVAALGVDRGLLDREDWAKLVVSAGSPVDPSLKSHAGAFGCSDAFKLLKYQNDRYVIHRGVLAWYPISGWPLPDPSPHQRGTRQAPRSINRDLSGRVTPVGPSPADKAETRPPPEYSGRVRDQSPASSPKYQGPDLHPAVVHDMEEKFSSLMSSARSDKADDMESPDPEFLRVVPTRSYADVTAPVPLSKEEINGLMAQGVISKDQLVLSTPAYVTLADGTRLMTLLPKGKVPLAASRLNQELAAFAKDADKGSHSINIQNKEELVQLLSKEEFNKPTASLPLARLAEHPDWVSFIDKFCIDHIRAVRKAWDEKFPSNKLALGNVPAEGSGNLSGPNVQGLILVNSTTDEIRLSALAAISSCILLRIQDPKFPLLPEMPESLCSLEGATYLAAVTLHYAQDARTIGFFTQTVLSRKTVGGADSALYKAPLGETLRRAYLWHEHGIADEADRSIEQLVTSLAKRMSTSLKNFPATNQFKYAGTKQQQSHSYGQRGQGSHPPKRGSTADDGQHRGNKHPRTGQRDNDKDK